MSLEGQQLGEFEILERLGQGGMGAVYKARQSSLDRIVALKTLQSALAGDADYIARFRQEAKAAALLNHPNLVHVHSAGESDGLHWFAMEYVEGESAQRRLDRKGRIEPVEAIAIVMHVATALDYGWRKAALIHRDIKPDNIFLSSDGEVKLGDLGLAKSVGQAQGITTVGATMGTPHYISPEQAEAMRDVDLRGDIYSLGCTLFHMLTGEAPYHGDSAMAVMIKHVNAPVPDMRAVWPECPAELAEAVLKMMQKRPDDRQQNYGDVCADLQRAYDAITGASSAGTSGKKRFPAARAIGAAAVCAAVGALLYFAPWKKGAQPSAQNVAQNPTQARANAPATQVSGKTVAVTTTPVPKTASTPAAAPTPIPKPSVSPTPAPSVTPRPLTEVEKWFAQVDGPQEEAFQKQVLKPFETGAASLRARYLAGVDAGIARASAAGQLDDALTWRSERKSFEKAQNVPPDDTGAPAIVKPLREDFRQQLARLDQDRAARAKLLHAQYDAVLAQNQTLLTQNQHLDDALLLKKKREEIALAWLRQPSLAGPGASSRGEFAASGFPLKASKEQPFVNTLGMKFVPVPGIKALFSIWDTRVQDYEVFARETGHEWRKQDFEQGPTHPAGNVSWEDAQAFCTWLTERERKAGKLGANEVYRLPTDHEWSCAAGIGDREDPAKLPGEKSGKIDNAFAWGSQWPPPPNAGNFADSAYHAKLPNQGWIEGYTDGFAASSPVGSFPANAFGLYDMGGNVWQWCEDWYDGTEKARVQRVAPWDAFERYRMLLSYRGRSVPGKRFPYYGFRCVLKSVPSSAAAAESRPVSSNPTGSDRPGLEKALPAAAKDAPFVNTLGMKFVPVPGTKALFSVWDTRVRDYAAYAQANKVDDAWTKQQGNGGPAGQELNHPVAGVNWDEAQAFCRWLTEKEIAEGKLPKGAKYRLPSDEEWSWAVGLPPELGATPAEKNGKNSVDFPWGKDYPPRTKVGNYADEAFHAKFPSRKNEKTNAIDHPWIEGYSDGYATASPVGSFPANAYGLYDMGGNVWQWCEDWFDASHKDRVVRGASWHTDARGSLLSSARGRATSTGRYDAHGFRCVLEPAPDSASGADSSNPAGANHPGLGAALPAAAKDAPFVNTLGMKFVPVPGTKALFSIWDTRVQDYAAYAQANKVDGSWKTQQEDGLPVSRDPEYPVVGVNLEDARAFCQWLTEKESAQGKLPRGAKYRLPTDEEWSRAVGLEKEDGATPKEKSGKDQAHFPWGAAFPPPKAKVGNYADSAFHERFPSRRWIEGYDDGYAVTSPVGAFPPNENGLYDMGGNVYQWCEDLFEPGNPNPVQRGACWQRWRGDDLLSSIRIHAASGSRVDDIGFRCVLPGE